MSGQTGQSDWVRIYGASFEPVNPSTWSNQISKISITNIPNNNDRWNCTIFIAAQIQKDSFIENNLPTFRSKVAENQMDQAITIVNINDAELQNLCELFCGPENRDLFLLAARDLRSANEQRRQIGQMPQRTQQLMTDQSVVRDPHTMLYTPTTSNLVRSQEDVDNDPIVKKLIAIIKEYDEKYKEKILEIPDKLTDEMTLALQNKNLIDPSTAEVCRYPIAVNIYMHDARSLLQWARTRISAGKPVTDPMNNEIIQSAEIIVFAPEKLTTIKETIDHAPEASANGAQKPKNI